MLHYRFIYDVIATVPVADVVTITEYMYCTKM